MNLREALLVAAGLALAATSAYGLELDPSEGPPNTCVRVRGGATFPEKGVEVRAHGKPLALRELAADHVRFQVPADAPAGPLEVEVLVEGRKVGTARYEVRVFKTDEERRAWRKRGETLEGASLQPTPIVRNLVLEVRGQRAVVTGETDLPKHFFLRVAFGVVTESEVELATTKVDLSGASFRAELGPFEPQLVGRFFAEVSFELARQAPQDQKRWHGAPVARVVAFCDAGTEESRRARETEAKALRVEAETLAKKLREALEMRLARSTFEPKAWESWLEASVFAPLRDEEARRAAFEKRWLGASEERASKDARQQVRAIVREAQRDSEALYGSSSKVPASIREPRGL